MITAMNEVSEELKSCPFCGSKASVRQVTPVAINNAVKYGYGGYFVMCNKCLTSGNNYPTRRDAQEAWNRRVTGENEYI